MKKTAYEMRISDWSSDVCSSDVWSKKVADHKEGYSISAAPMVINGKLITGVAGGEFGVVGKFSAYDPTNGELLWTRPTVGGQMGSDSKDGRSEERRVGKEGVSTCRYRGLPDTKKKK